MSLRNEILQVSKDLLIKEGFGKISMRRIAGRANITATSIYLHFESKDDLLLTLIEESIKKLKQALSDAVNDAVTKEYGLIDQLRILADTYINYALDHPQEYEIIYMVRPEEMPRYPKDKFRDVRSAYELIANIIREANHNEYAEAEDSLISAYTFWAQLHGVVSVILNKRLDTRIPQSTFIDQSIQHIIKGFINQKIPV